MKKVSIVIPVRDGENYLAAAIESVQAQDYPHLDLIVCDGGSVDRSAEVAKDYGVQIVQGELGLVPNWRAALKVATGDYVKLLCHDDTLRSDCISRQVAALDADPSLMLVSCQRQYINAKGEDDGTMILQTTDKRIDGRSAFWLMTQYGNLIGETSCCLHRRTAIEFPADLNWLCDMWMWGSLFVQGDYLYVADLLANIRRHPGQDTHRVLADPNYHGKEISDKAHIQALYERAFL